MIAKWLDQDFEHLFERNPQVSVILWFDDRGDFARLLDDGKFPPGDANYRLLRYDEDAGHGQLWLKAQIVWEPRDLSQDEREKLKWVLYLPFEREATEIPTGEPGSLEYLLEYRYRGTEWLVGGKKPTLFGFLRDHNVPLPDRPAEQRKLWEGGRDSLLAKYAAKFCDRDEAFWRQSLTPAKVRQRIIGDLHEHLFEVLADPEHAVDYLAEEDLLDEFKREVQQQFGMRGHIEENPRRWVEDFTIRLAMTECYRGYGEPEDFPFDARVADVDHRQQCLRFLDSWLRHRDFGHVYQELIRELEGEYNLTRWAEGRKGSCESLLHLAEMEWNDFYSGLSDVAGSRSESAEFLEANRERIEREREGYWAEHAEVLTGWGIATDLVTVTQESANAEEEADSLTDAEEFIDAYAKQWHEIDRAYWEVFAAVRTGGDFEQMQAVADLHYGRYLESVNMAFQDALRAEGDLPEREVLESSASMWDDPSRHAIIMVDALRFDLAMALSEEFGDDADIEAWIAPVPPVTSVGMTALLAPDPEEVTVEVDAGKLVLEHNEFGDLAFKPNRVSFMEKHFGAQTVELNELLSPDCPDFGEDAPLVVFTRDIDSIGHGTGAPLAKHFALLLEDLSAGVRKLQRRNYETIHLVTDHGFLLPVNAEEYDGEIPSNICREARHLILTDAAATDLLTLPMKMSGDLRLAFAPGARSFGAPKSYMHGGASLQELVVPHLTVRTEQVARKADVEVRLKTTEISTLTIRVDLVTDAPETLFDSPQARTVEVYVTRDAERVSASKEVTIGGDDRSVGVTLFLDDEAGLKKGDVLRLRARDTETDEELLENITLNVVRDF